MLEHYLHRLRNYYWLRNKFSPGLSWLPFWRKWLKRRAKRQNTSNFILLPNGLLAPADASDPATYDVWLRGKFLPDLEWVVDKFAKRGSVAVDVGANLGFASIIMAAKVGDDGEVFAIEPNPCLYHKLQKAFSLNGFKNCHILQCACSSSADIANFFIDESDHTQSRVTQEGVGIEIQALTLDHILKHVKKPISFIKIDVEGYEFDVLSGAAEIIDKHRPVIVFETGMHTSEQILEIRKLLNSLNYEVIGVLHEWGIEAKELSSKMTERSHCNILALPL